MGLDSVRANKVRGADHLGVAIASWWSSPWPPPSPGSTGRCRRSWKPWGPRPSSSASSRAGSTFPTAPTRCPLAPQSLAHHRRGRAAADPADGAGRATGIHRRADGLRRLQALQRAADRLHHQLARGLGRHHHRGRNWTDIEFAAGANVAVINDKLGQTMFPGVDPIGKRIKIYGQPFQVVGVYAEASSLFGGGSSSLAMIPHHLHQGGRLVQGLARLRGPSHRSRDGRGRSGRRDRRPAGPGLRPARRTTSRW